MAAPAALVVNSAATEQKLRGPSKNSVGCKPSVGKSLRWLSFIWQCSWSLLFIVNIFTYSILPGLREWSGGYLFLLHFSTFTGVLGLCSQIFLVVLRFTKCGADFKRTRWYKAVLITLAVVAFIQLLYFSLWFWVFASTSAAPQTYATWDASQGKRRIAVIGAGPAGTSAAITMGWQPEKFDVTVFEAQSQIGGHGYGTPFHYIDTKGNNRTADIDMGFIFGGATKEAYPAMRSLLATLGADIRYSGIEVSNTDPDTNEVYYATNAPETQPQDEFERFYNLLAQGPNQEDMQIFDILETFGDWMDKHEFDDEFRAKYCTPLFMTLFIIKTGMFEMPLAFIRNMFQKYIDFYHATPAWVVEGSSRRMYDFATKVLQDTTDLRLDAPVHAVTRLDDGRVRVTMPDGSSEVFDGVVLATQADIAKDMLQRGGTSSLWEQAVLKQVAYDGYSDMTLHTDRSFFPKEQKYWKNFNFRMHQEGEFTHRNHFEFNAHMSKIFGLDIDLDKSEIPILTTNQIREIPEDKIIDVKRWHHHQQDTFHFLMVVLFFPYLHDSSVAFAGEWLEAIGHDVAMQEGGKASGYMGAFMSADEREALKAKYSSYKEQECVQKFPQCPPPNELDGNTPPCYNKERQPLFECVEEENSFKPFELWMQDMLTEKYSSYVQGTGSTVSTSRDIFAGTVFFIWACVIVIGCAVAVLFWVKVKQSKAAAQHEAVPKASKPFDGEKLTDNKISENSGLLKQEYRAVPMIEDETASTPNSSSGGTPNSSSGQSQAEKAKTEEAQLTV